VPGTKFQVSRQVNKQSVSRYMINNKESTFKEVCELLSSKGIDLEHNRFLILQGEVEQISLMKPKAQNENETGLLEYLEDIIGSNVHVPRIEELEKQIESKNEDRIEKTNRVKAAQHELKNLEEDRNNAVDYIKKERTLMQLDNINYFIELGEGVKKVNECVKTIEEKKNLAKEVRERKK
jgi:structural maintenance of chromosome 4